MEEVRRRRLAEKGPSKKVRQKDPSEKVHQRRSAREDGCLKRWLALEPTMALIPCEMREENNVSLLNE